jgi:hypothetical protein
MLLHAMREEGELDRERGGDIADVRGASEGIR